MKTYTELVSEVVGKIEPYAERFTIREIDSHVDRYEGDPDDEYDYRDDITYWEFAVFKDNNKIGYLEYEDYFGEVSGKLMGKETPEISGYGQKEAMRARSEKDAVLINLRVFLSSKTGKKWATTGKLRGKGLLD